MAQNKPISGRRQGIGGLPLSGELCLAHTARITDVAATPASESWFFVWSLLVALASPSRVQGVSPECKGERGRATATPQRWLHKTFYSLHEQSSPRAEKRTSSSSVGVRHRCAQGGKDSGHLWRQESSGAVICSVVSSSYVSAMHPVASACGLPVLSV